MGLRERVLEAVGIPTAQQIGEQVKEAYISGYNDGNDDPAQGDFKKGGLGYKKLSDNYVRSGKIDFTQAITVAWELWQKSPIAKRVLAMKRDHIIGHSAEPSASNDDLQMLLDDFWDSNKMDKRASEFTMQLFGFGEQCFPAFVRESDGRVLLGYIDPQSIVSIVKNPDNTMEDYAVVCEKYNADGSYSTEKRVYRIIREAEDYSDGDTVTSTQYEGKLVTWEQATLQDWEMEVLAKYDRPEYDGSCFYTKVNSVSNQSRGMSDLLQVGDWIDQADDVLFALADREQYAGYFSFDVTATGLDPDAIRTRSNEIRMNPPRKGSVNVHNEHEIWELFSPDLHQSGSIETFRAILGLILGGMGFPVHWYGYGDDANRATATVQANPTEKSLEHDQGVVRDMFLKMCQFVADQAEIANNYTAQDDDEIKLNLPEVSTRDFGVLAASVQGMTVALSNMVAEGWITNDKAAEINAKMLAEFDVKIDVTEELAQAERDGRQDDLDAMARQNGQLQQAMAMAGIKANGDNNGQPTHDG